MIKRIASLLILFLILGSVSLAHTEETIDGISTTVSTLPTLTSVPASPTNRQEAWFDGVIADPCGLGIGKSYKALYDGSDWIAQYDEDGTYYHSSIALTTLKASELNDTSDPHLLITAELQNKLLNNSESSGADEWDFPAAAENWNFMFNKAVDQSVTLDPNASEAWVLNGTAITGGNCIRHTVSATNESIACRSEDVNGTIKVLCESKYSNWVEAACP